MTTQPVTFEQIIAYAAGELDAASNAIVEQFIAANTSAADAVRTYRVVLQTARLDDTVEPPAATISAAQALMAEKLARRQPTNWLDALKRIVADLAFDSRPRLAGAGLRGATESYQLSYESPTASVDIEVERYVEGGQLRFRLMGQVTPTGDGVVGTVALSAPGKFEPITLATPDERGVFSITTDAGTFDVLVMLDNAVIVLPGIDAK